MPAATQLEFAGASVLPASSEPRTEIVPGPALMPPVNAFALLKATVVLSSVIVSPALPHWLIAAGVASAVL